MCAVSNIVNTELTPERKRVLDLHDAGLTPREIATVLGLSTQRIYKQLKRLGQEPNPPKAGVAS